MRLNAIVIGLLSCIGAATSLVPTRSECAAEEPPGSSAAERTKAFEWFDTLGFPDVKGKPFVRVATGWWSQVGDDPPVNHYRNGFLLKEDGEDFTVFLLDCETNHFTKTAPKMPDHQRVGFDVQDLAQFADTTIQSLRKLGANEERRDVWRRFGEKASETSEVFVAAWACDRNGLWCL